MIIIAKKSEIQKIEIGKRIKAVRQSFGLEQGEFGKRLTPPAYASNVSKWELGKHLPSSQRLQSIAKLGHVSVDFLLNGFTSDKDKEFEELRKIRLKLPKDSYVHTKEGNEGHFINCKENRDENYIELTREGLDVLLNDIFKSNRTND